METFRIGAVAKAAGIGAQKLHYYEHLGLVAAPARSTSGYREYGPVVIHRIRTIKCAQGLGLTPRR